MRQKLCGRPVLAKNLSVLGFTVALAIGCAGCDEDYAQKSQPFYESLYRLEQDVYDNVPTTTFADDLTAADQIHEQWAQQIGARGLRRKSAREFAECLQIYGRAGTLHVMDGTKKIVNNDFDRLAFHRAGRALERARFDLVDGR